MADEPDPFEHTRMTLGQHLNELRKRLFRSAIALLVAVMISWAFYPQLTEVVLWPMRYGLERVDREQREKYVAVFAEELKLDPTAKRTKYFVSEDPADLELRPELTVSQRPVQTEMGGGFAFAIKVSTYGALILGAPWILWELWQFIGAGLFAREKRVILRFFPISVGLFAAGILFGYFVLCPYGFYFMLTVFPPEDIALLPAIGPYLDLFQGVSLALGAVFEIPLLMYGLVRFDLVQRATFAKYRGHWVVGAFLIGGILTPPDPFTQFMLAVPMIGLYELGLLWTWFLPKKKAWTDGEVQA